MAWLGYVLEEGVGIGGLENLIAPEHGQQIIGTHVLDLVRIKRWNRDELRFNS